MRTVTQKREGRFEMLNIMIDSITDVDLLEKVIRGAENDDNTLLTANEQITLSELLRECQSITKIPREETF